MDTKSNISTPDGACPCTPKWVKELNLHENHCLICDNKLPIKEPTAVKTFVFHCLMKPSRIHSIAIRLCGSEDKNCTSKFLTNYDNPKYMSFVSWIPFSFLRNSEAHTFIEASLGKMTGRYCKNCNNRETNKTPNLKTCSGCMKVSYCSKECQKENWRNHKIRCKAFQGKATQEELDQLNPSKCDNLPTPNEKIKIPICACLDEKDLHRFQAANNGTCSAFPCNNEIVGTIEYRMYIVKCTLLKEAIHICPKHYCSQRCLKRDNKQS